MDGSQKLPQRILSTVSERLEAGAVPQGLCLSVAAWMRYVGGMDESGQPIDVRDPMLNELSKATGGQGVDVVGNLLDLQEIFGSRISENADFRSAVANWYKALCADGAQKTVATFVAGQPGRR